MLGEHGCNFIVLVCSALLVLYYAAIFIFYGEKKKKYSNTENIKNAMA